FHTYPSLKHDEDRQRLWSALKDGTLSTVATDELCTPRAIKVRSRHIADATGGHVGVETRLPIIYTEGVSMMGRRVSTPTWPPVATSAWRRACPSSTPRGCRNTGCRSNASSRSPRRR